MLELTFGLTGIAAWQSAFGTAPTDYVWLSPDNAPSVPSRGPAPPLLRRRVGPIGQTAMRLAWSLPDVDAARYVFASRHGEFDRALALLTQVADAEGVSPADFSLGVHNALAGLLSLATRNRRGHIALAAGIDSFGAGLLEAVACVLDRPEEPVILVYFDANLPPDYPDPVPAAAESTMALALTLMPAERARRRVAMTATASCDAVPGECAAAVFLRFLATDAPSASAVGERMAWSWRHV